MNLDNEIKLLTSFVNNKIDPTKKTIMIQSAFSTYRKTVDYIADKLIKSDKFNIILIYGEKINSSFETKDCSFQFYPYYVYDNENIENKINLEFVDLVIIDDRHSDEFIDTKWMAQNTPRMHLPHNILIWNIDTKVEYGFIPSIVNLQNTQYYMDNNVCLIKGGYPKLDVTIKEYKNKLKMSKVNGNAILYAPTTRCLDSWGTEEYFNANTSEYNESVGFDYHIIKILLDNFDEDIIFRPHPHHGKRDHRYLQLLMAKFSNEPRVILSKNDYIDDYVQSKFMVSDLSQTPYTYSLATLKPIVVFVASSIKRGGVSNDFANNFGFHVETLTQLVSKAKKLNKNINKFEIKIKKYRDNNIFNIGKSIKVLIKSIEQIVNHKKLTDVID